jgi:hypothetical protein
MKERYGNIDVELARKGIEESLKVKIHNLEVAMEGYETGSVEAAFKEYLTARELAKTFGINTENYDGVILNERADELKKRFRIIWR